MADFNRSNRSGAGYFNKRAFSDRGSRGPAQMHQAVCDNCGKNCEVPFRPTSGKPIFCSSCFENNRGFDSRPSSFEDKRMFEAVCNECGNSCKVPFQPRGDKPVFCSNCFGEKKGNGGGGNEQFEVLNSKLDRILAFLTPNAVDKVEEVVVEEVSEVKKSPSKKKSLNI